MFMSVDMLLLFADVIHIIDRVNLGYASLQMGPDLHLSPRAYELKAQPAVVFTFTPASNYFAFCRLG